MYRIVRKEALRPTVTLYEIEAPLIAKKAQPGQFIILRTDENGERIPITINAYDPEKGTVTIIVQTVGATTVKLSHMKEGDCLADFVGPLGKPTETEGKKKVAVVGGGVGCAIAYPVLKKFHDDGAEVHAIVGFRSEDLVILEEDFKKSSDKLIVCTDDGSYGRKGLVTEALKELIDAGSAVAGCGGAFACLFMEALSDGAVTCGLPRAKANTFAAQMLLGAAQLALESGKPFGLMKDEICSPGGTTIAGVRALEEGGLRAAAMNAVIAAYRRTLELKQ